MGQMSQRLRELSQLKAAEYSSYLRAADAAAAEAAAAADGPIPPPAADLAISRTSTRRPCLLKVPSHILI